MGERKLWLSVIRYAVKDMLYTIPTTTEYRESTIARRKIIVQRAFDKERAYDWFFKHNIDFPEVCMLAGLRWQWVRRKAKEMLKDPEMVLERMNDEARGYEYNR